jgi:hypothetical protein
MIEDEDRAADDAQPSAANDNGPCAPTLKKPTASIVSAAPASTQIVASWKRSRA